MLKTFLSSLKTIGSILVFVLIAVALIFSGKTDAVRRKYDELVNKNRGKQDYIKEKEDIINDNIVDAKDELDDLQNKGKELEDRIGGKTDHNKAIDDFQKKYGS